MNAQFDSSQLLAYAPMLLLIAMGGLATLGQIFMTKAFRTAPPQNLSLIALSQVVFALGFDLYLWNREVRPLAYLGMLLVLLPVAWLVAARKRSPLPA